MAFRSVATKMKHARYNVTRSVKREIRDLDSCRYWGEALRKILGNIYQVPNFYKLNLAEIVLDSYEKIPGMILGKDYRTAVLRDAEVGFNNNHYKGETKIIAHRVYERFLKTANDKLAPHPPVREEDIKSQPYQAKLDFPASFGKEDPIKVAIISRIVRGTTG